MKVIELSRLNDTLFTLPTIDGSSNTLIKAVRIFGKSNDIRRVPAYLVNRHPAVYTARWIELIDGVRYDIPHKVDNFYADFGV